MAKNGSMALRIIGLTIVIVSTLSGYMVAIDLRSNEKSEKNQDRITDLNTAFMQHCIQAEKQWKEYAIKQEHDNGEIKSLIVSLSKDIEHLKTS